MSMESARAYIERMKTDEDFRKKISECKDKESRMDCAMKEGYDFTAEELKMQSSELSDVELSSISAGIDNWQCYLQLPINQ